VPDIKPSWRWSHHCQRSRVASDFHWCCCARAHTLVALCFW